MTALTTLPLSEQLLNADPKNLNSFENTVTTILKSVQDESFIASSQDYHALALAALDKLAPRAEKKDVPESDTIIKIMNTCLRNTPEPLSWTPKFLQRVVVSPTLVYHESLLLVNSALGNPSINTQEARHAVFLPVVPEIFAKGDDYSRKFGKPFIASFVRNKADLVAAAKAIQEEEAYTDKIDFHKKIVASKTTFTPKKRRDTFNDFIENQSIFKIDPEELPSLQQKPFNPNLSMVGISPDFFPSLKPEGIEATQAKKTELLETVFYIRKNTNWFSGLFKS